MASVATQLPFRILSLGLSLGLAACTTTYGPADPPALEPVNEQAPCAVGDTRSGCSAESTPCQNPHDYLCAEGR